MDIAFCKSGSARRSPRNTERLQEMEDACIVSTARVGLRFVTEHHVLSSPRESTWHCQVKCHAHVSRSKKDDVLGRINHPRSAKEVTRGAHFVFATDTATACVLEIKLSTAFARICRANAMPHHLHLHAENC
jgi:hypothetical protein